MYSWLAVLLVTGYIALLTSQLLLIILGGALVCIFRGLAAPNIKVLVNNSIDNEYRATVNSVVGASFRVATLVLGPLMGFMVDQHSALTATAWLVLLIIPAMAGLFVLDRKLVQHRTELAA